MIILIVHDMLVQNWWKPKILYNESEKYKQNVKGLEDG